MRPALVLIRPTRRRRGRRWRVLDTACARQEHYRNFDDCRCRVFANKALAEAYLTTPSREGHLT